MQEKTVVCLKYGTKYSPEYVNKLRSMTLRHCECAHNFICITDDSSDLRSDIQTISLTTHSDIHGWWYKTFLFNPVIGLRGDVLFLDLDVVVFNDLTKFFTHSAKEFCISRGFRKDNKNGMNSSCFRFEAGTHSYIFNDFMKNRKEIMGRLHGDQDWIQERIESYSFWPDNWLMSYKWDMINKFGNVKYNDETSIAVFHGKPNPHELTTTAWIKQNWK